MTPGEKAMNYRHIYHAGNFADVFKHLLLVLCLDHLRRKEAGFFALDAHAGCGLYDLQSEQAQKTLEYKDGVGKLIRHCEEQRDEAIQNAVPKAAWVASPAARHDVETYLQLVKEDMKRGLYPGSPLLIARMLRAQDRLVANELHPEDGKTLEKTLQKFRPAQVTMTDAYQSVRAQVPPRERRGLVLVDPPFEKTDEFETLRAQIREWEKRWASGTFILWFPVKDRAAVEALYEAAAGSGFKRVWACALKIAARPDESETKLKETGLILLNAPYQVPERMDAAMAQAAPLMDGSYSSRWLTADAGEKT
jgi:23S rRNA (adenine2030-N6)-methyltransferase